MKLVIIFVLFTLCIAEEDNTDLRGFWPSCQKSQVLPTFNVKDILDKWYLFETNQRYKGEQFKCASFTFKNNTKTNMLNLIISTEVLGLGVIVDTVLNQTAVARYKQHGLLGFDSTFQILDTDHSTYIVAETCSSYPLFVTRKGLVLTSSKKPKATLGPLTHDILKTHGFKIDKTFYVVEQEQCDYDLHLEEE